MLDEMSFATITPKGAENRLNRAIAPNDYRVHTLARHHQSRRSKFKFLFKQT